MQRTNQPPNNLTMKVGTKLRELFSHQKAVKKYLRSIDNQLQPKAVYIFLACAITETENKSEFSFYRVKDVIQLLDKMELVSVSNPHQFYRDHKKLIDLGFIDRITIKQKYTRQQFCVTLYGRTQLRRIYNYLIRELYSPL